MRCHRPYAVSPPRVLDVGGGVCFCLCVCMPACAGAVTPRSAVATETRRASCGSPPSRRSVLQFVSRRGERRRRHPGRACAVVVGSVPHAMSLPRVFDVDAGLCVCLCACMPACTGEVTPRSVVASPTRQASCESHPHRGAACCRIFFFTGAKIVACTESVCALPSVGQAQSTKEL